MDIKITTDNKMTYKINERVENEITFIDFHLDLEKRDTPKEVILDFTYDAIDLYGVWSPLLRPTISLNPEWNPTKTYSQIASGAPVHQLFSQANKNRLTIALSDPMTPTAISTGIIEKNARLRVKIHLFVSRIAEISSYDVTIRLDGRDIASYDAIYDTVAWWESLGFKNAYAPKEVFLPMLSTWYNYHQDFTPEEIRNECRLAKTYGMDTVIVDDGWQTETTCQGYASCGDWEPYSGKVGKMTDFVDGIHKTGMKALLWLSVPFLGEDSKNFERFKDKVMADGGARCRILDPRFRDVREFLIETYEKVIRDWHFDGVKLDFIDMFQIYEETPVFDDRRDITSVEEAVDVLLCEVTKRLKKINPDVMIEFRQKYIGPYIRKYGNMFRVTDCPVDPIINRSNHINLRLLSGGSATHSDMLIWNVNETVENAAKQFVGTFLAVPQISVRLAEIPDSHKKMLKNLLDLWLENKDTINLGKTLTYRPESCFSLAVSEYKNSAVAIAYAETPLEIKWDNTLLMNATGLENVYIKGENLDVDIYNCMGDRTNSIKVTDNALCEINIPVSGYAKIKKINLKSKSSDLLLILPNCC